MATREELFAATVLKKLADLDGLHTDSPDTVRALRVAARYLEMRERYPAPDPGDLAASARALEGAADRFAGYGLSGPAAGLRRTAGGLRAPMACANS